MVPPTEHTNSRAVSSHASHFCTAFQVPNLGIAFVRADREIASVVGEGEGGNRVGCRSCHEFGDLWENV